MIIRKKHIKYFILISMLSLLAFSIGIKLQNKELIITKSETMGISTEWQNYLYTPTMVEKIENTYFIIDCWHNRIIYNDNLHDEIKEWNTLTNDIVGGHSIASDGEVYLCDDTDNSGVRVFKKNVNKFKQTQIITGVTGRPHFIKYDDKTNIFYVISSTEGKLWTFKNYNGIIKNEGVYTIRNLENTYTRSFNIIDGYMYMVSGPGYIYKVKYDDKSYKIVESYEVPSEITGMNFIEKIDDYYYISSYTNSKGDISPMFVRIKNLKLLKDRKYEDLYSKFGFKGTPYYISKFDNKYFITEIDQSSGIKSFEVNNNKISNIETYYYFKGHTDSSQKRKELKY